MKLHFPRSDITEQRQHYRVFMKILFIRTDFFGPLRTGGSFSHIAGFLDGLQELGHTVALTASAPCFEAGRYQFYHIPYPKRFVNFPEFPSIGYNRVLERELPLIIEAFQPDILYQRHSEYIYTTSILARKYNLPLLLEANNSEWWWKKNWGHVFFEKLLRRSEEFQFVNADAILVVSEVLKNDLIRLFGLPPDKVFVNPNGVDIQAFRHDISPDDISAAVPEQYLATWNNKHLCGFVGTFGEWHGVEVLAESIRSTVERCPDVHFLLIGDGKLRPKVEEIIRRDKVENYVTLTGAVAHAAVPKYLAKCEVLLSPHTENTDGTIFFGSPTKLFEYMGMGKPVIASNVGQIGSVIRHNENGILVPQRNPAALAEAIAQIVADKPTAERLGAAARHDAETAFSWKHNAQRALDALARVKTNIGM